MELNEILQSIENTSSKKEKERILAENKDHAELRTYLQYAYDPHKIFHIANLERPATRLTDNFKDNETGFASFAYYLDALAAGAYVGNAAREMMTSLLTNMTGPTQKWAYRCLMKDPKLGITAITINKAIPGLIPEFKIALADSIDMINGEFSQQLRFPLWVDPKLDGIRCICIKRGDDVRLYSRTGHEILTVPHIVDTLLLDAPVLDSPDSFVLDGELMGRDWNETQSILSSKKKAVDHSRIKYNVFDWLSIEEWDQKRCATSYANRIRRLQMHLPTEYPDRVCAVEGRLVQDVAGVQQAFVEYTARGFEGVMVKDYEAYYQFKRSKAIMKIKPKISLEGRIVGWEKGAKNGKWENGFGAFLVEINGVITSVGGGYSDEARGVYYNALQYDPEIFNGEVAEIEGQELTKDGKVRFPVFKQIRYDHDL